MHSVEKIWESCDLDTVMAKVFDKLRVIFCNILRGDGSNDLVKENRGKKNRNVKLEEIIKQIERDNNDGKTINLQDCNGFAKEEEGIAQIQLI